MIKKRIFRVNSCTGTLVLGITFKENCPDVRNTKVVDLIKPLKEYGLILQSMTHGREKEVIHEYGLTTLLYQMKSLMPLY